MEPRAPTPQRRLEALRTLNAAGVPAGVLTAPLIPAINDAELATLLEAAVRTRARHDGYVLLPLPREITELFAASPEAPFPDHSTQLSQLMRATPRGGLSHPTFC